MTDPVNTMQGSQIEVTEDREAVLDCVSPGGKPAPDVRVFHLETVPPIPTDILTNVPISSSGHLLKMNCQLR